MKKIEEMSDAEFNEQRQLDQHLGNHAELKVAPLGNCERCAAVDCRVNITSRAILDNVAVDMDLVEQFTCDDYLSDVSPNDYQDKSWPEK